jgi:membrane-bound acyltransferase YfiQ involved in biofilm formation
MGIFVFGRNLHSVYGDNINILKAVIVDFMGIRGLGSYNITWWFNQLIIYLYIIFPLLFVFTKKWCIPTLLISLLLLEFSQLSIPCMDDLLVIIHDWLFPFVLGIACAVKSDKITVFLNRYNKYLILILSFLMLFTLVLMRTYSIIPHFSGTRLDGFLSINIAGLSILFFRNIPYISTLFHFLGKHSMNIFMIHTFIFAYFFEEFIYSFHYPIVIFCALLISSLISSILLELIKKQIRLSVLVEKVSQKINRSKL